MPIVRIDLVKQPSPDLGKQIGAVVYEAMNRTINVPEHDNFQLINEYEKSHFVYDPGYLGISRSDNLIFIQITLNEGRTTEMKKALFKAIADGLQERVNVRPEDVFITLVEVKKENWSFGNGVAQYAA